MLEKFILICKNTFVSSNFGGGGGVRWEPHFSCTVVVVVAVVEALMMMARQVWTMTPQ